jgi:tetratricopeptide (TPR) repeat protein
VGTASSYQADARLATGPVELDSESRRKFLEYEAERLLTKRSIVLTVLLALAGIGAVLASQALIRDRDYRALLARGDSALADDQTFGAIEAYSGAIALRPDSMLAHLRRGQTYERRGDLDAASRDFRAAAALDPSSPRALDELGDTMYQRQWFGRAIDAYETCLRIDDRAPRVVYKLGLARYRNGDIDGALTALTQAVRLDENMPYAHYLLGLCLRTKHNESDAQRALERAVSLAPTLVPAREELADLYRSMGRRAEELDQLETIATLDGAHSERQVAVGLAQARAGQPELAVRTLGNALSRSPGHPLLYAALGEVWLDIAETRNDRVALSKALEALARVASGNGATSEALTLYGRALLRDRQTGAAEDAFRRAMDQYPVDPSAFLFYAATVESQSRWEAARRALIQYGTLVPDDAGFATRAIRIASLSTRLNDHESAVEWLERAISAAPTDPRTFLAFANAQIAAGDKAGARSTVARGLTADPDSSALQALARQLR